MTANRCAGVSNYFSCGARTKIAGAPRFEAEVFTEARNAERGRVGEGSGGSPREIFGKLPQMHILKNIVAAFRGMHVSPAKHSYA